MSFEKKTLLGTVRRALSLCALLTVTTTVNFGDKPTGCIAIAAIRETAERFGGDYPEASWFLKYRTYVDDATAGANSMERLQACPRS
jgi:hypothetical protein